MIQEQARHGLGEALVVREVDVEIPESGNQVSTRPVNSLDSPDLCVGSRDRSNASVVHYYGLSLPYAVDRVDYRDVFDGQVGGGRGRTARDERADDGERDCVREIPIEHCRRLAGVS